MPAKYASPDAGLRLAMTLLFLVSATTKVTEAAAIQAYMHDYGVPGMLVWPADFYGWPRPALTARVSTPRLRLVRGEPCGR